MTLKISRLPNGEPEIFASIQGEGVSMGTPSVFVRLALCNLHCAWCDTRYTWDWKQYDPGTSIISLEPAEVIALVRRLAAAEPAPAPRAEPDGTYQPGSGARNVVITGGEPLLQAAALAELLPDLRAAGYRIEVETNGTVHPPEALHPLVDQWNVSPKLASSENSTEQRDVAPSLAWFAAMPTAFFKFVVTTEADITEVVALVSRYTASADRVLLMPEGSDAATLQARSQWLVPHCQRLGFRFTTRLHILLWGNARGR